MCQCKYWCHLQHHKHSIKALLLVPATAAPLRIYREAISLRVRLRNVRITLHKLALETMTIFGYESDTLVPEKNSGGTATYIGTD